MTEYAVNYRMHNTHIRQDVRAAKDELMVSFDISSLFTNVLINEAVQIIQNKQNHTLSQQGC